MCSFTTHLWTLRSSGTVCGGLFNDLSRNEGPASWSFSSFLEKKIVKSINFFPRKMFFWYDQFPFLDSVLQPRPCSHLARLGFWWRARRAFSSSNSSLSAAFSSLSFVFSCLTFGQNTILLLRVCVFALCVDVLQKSWLWNFISLQIRALSTDPD